MTHYTPSPVMLSSVEKIAFFLGISAGNGRVDGVNSDTEEQRRNRRIIVEWARAISNSFQTYCNREFIIMERTQFFDVLAAQSFFPAAVPILSISEIANDPLGLFQGGEWVVQSDSYHLSQTGNAIEMIWNIALYGQNTLRVKYTGGLAYDATKSVFLLSEIEGGTNITAGRYAEGSISGAIGKVVGTETVEGGTSITMDNIYGAFLAGEALSFQSSIYGQDIPATSAVIASITSQSLCEAYPELNRALEFELSVRQKRESNPQVQSEGGMKTGATYRVETDMPNGYQFQPETRQILDQFKRIMVGL